MKSRTLILSILLSLLCMSSCVGTYTDPRTGQTISWEYPNRPDPDEARDAFEKLEKAIRENLTAMREATQSGNSETLELAQSNIERIADAKSDLHPYMKG